MSYPLPPVAISASGTAVVSLGSVSGVGSVVIANESPYGIMASVGGSARWIPAQFVDRMDCNTGAFDGTLTLTTNDYLTNAASAPSFIVLVTVYPPGEPVLGTYPAALSRVANVGNTLATSTSAANAFEQDLLTPFVLTGYVATKDGSVANQLDVTSGIAFLRQSDSSLGRIANLAATYLTIAPSTTYFLDLNPDASWSFATSHSAVANHLTIASCTTDSSGNILAVTDARTLNSTLLTSMLGDLIFSQSISLANGFLLFQLSDGAYIHHDTGAHWTEYKASASGAASAHLFTAWDGAANQIIASIGAMDAASAPTWIGVGGTVKQVAGQAAAGNFGVPVIVAQALDVQVTSTAAVTIVQFTPAANGVYRVSAYIYMGNGSNADVLAYVSFVDSHNSLATNAVFTNNNSYLATTPATLGTATTSTTNAGLTSNPVVVYAKAGNAIQFVYQDRTGTPNDFVSGIIERLS